MHISSGGNGVGPFHTQHVNIYLVHKQKLLLPAVAKHRFLVWLGPTPHRHSPNRAFTCGNKRVHILVNQTSLQTTSWCVSNLPRQKNADILCVQSDIKSVQCAGSCVYRSFNAYFLEINQSQRSSFALSKERVSTKKESSDMYFLYHETWTARYLMILLQLCLFLQQEPLGIVASRIQLSRSDVMV